MLSPELNSIAADMVEPLQIVALNAGKSDDPVGIRGYLKIFLESLVRSAVVTDVHQPQVPAKRRRSWATPRVCDDRKAALKLSRAGTLVRRFYLDGVKFRLPTDSPSDSGPVPAFACFDETTVTLKAWPEGAVASSHRLATVADPRVDILVQAVRRMGSGVGAAVAATTILSEIPRSASRRKERHPMLRFLVREGALRVDVGLWGCFGRIEGAVRADAESWLPILRAFDRHAPWSFTLVDVDEEHIVVATDGRLFGAGFVEPWPEVEKEIMENPLYQAMLAQRELYHIPGTDLFDEVRMEEDRRRCHDEWMAELMEKYGIEVPPETNAS
jgi:hypothetical protein